MTVILRQCKSYLSLNIFTHKNKIGLNLSSLISRKISCNIFILRREREKREEKGLNLDLVELQAPETFYQILVILRMRL